MEAEGIALGIVSGMEFLEEIVDFSSGDVMIMYTDGIIEAFNLQKEMFGIDNLKKIAQKNADKSADEIIDSVSKAINDFAGGAAQHDDITIVVIKAL